MSDFFLPPISSEATPGLSFVPCDRDSNCHRATIAVMLDGQLSGWIMDEHWHGQVHALLTLPGHFTSILGICQGHGDTAELAVVAALDCGQREATAYLLECLIIRGRINNSNAAKVMVSR